jgi:hypothetical protein
VRYGTVFVTCGGVVMLTLVELHHKLPSPLNVGHQQSRQILCVRV